MSDPMPPEKPSTSSVRKDRAKSALGVFLGALAVWTVWAVGITRGAIDPYRVFSPYWAVMRPTHTILFLSVLISALFTSRHRWLRYVFAPLPLIVGYPFAILTNRVVAWDMQFVLALGFVGMISAVFAARLAPTRKSRRGMLLVPFLALGLIFFTQMISPKAPTWKDAERVYAKTGIRIYGENPIVTPGPGCPNFTRGYDNTSHYENPGDLMTVSSVCNNLAVEMIATFASDGCYSRTDAYATLAFLLGPYADDIKTQEYYVQGLLTSAWLHRANRMDTGFCLYTYAGKREAVSPTKEVLFTVSPRSYTTP